jgi:hypothetical protein
MNPVGWSFVPLFVVWHASLGIKRLRRIGIQAGLMHESFRKGGENHTNGQNVVELSRHSWGD